MALRDFLFAFVTASVVLAVRADAQDQDPPLFAAFKRFCLDAGADAEQVKLAVEMAGGKPHNPPGGSTIMPWPMTVESWDIIVQGHKMILNIGRSHRRRGRNTANCILSSFSDESVGIEALRKWVGVPKSIGAGMVEIYSFEQDGPMRKPGNSWQLAIVPRANSVQLTHVLAPGPRRRG